MGKKNGAILVWFSILVVPVMLIAFFALVDFNRYRNDQYRLKAITTRAVEWSIFKNEMDLAEVYNLGSYTKEGFEGEFIEELKRQQMDEEHLAANRIGIERIVFEKPLNSIEVIKEVILETHHLKFGVNNVKKIVEITQIAEQFKGIFEKTFQILEIVDEVDKLQGNYSLLSGKYKEIRGILTSEMAGQAANMATTAIAIKSNLKNLESELSHINGEILRSLKDATHKKQLLARKNELELTIDENVASISNLRIQITQLVNAMNSLEEIITKFKELSNDLVEVMELLDALTEYSTEQAGDGFLGGFVNVCSKTITAIDVELRQLTPNVLSTVNNFKKSLIVASSILVQVDDVAKGNFSEAHFEVPELPELSPTVLLEKALKPAIESKELLDVKAWLDKQMSIDFDSIEQIYGGEIPEVIFKTLPSKQAQSLNDNADQSAFKREGNPLKDMKRATNFWSELNEFSRKKSEQIMEKAIVGDYVLDYMTYNVPSKHSRKSYLLGQVEYILIGNQMASINAAAVDAQIGLMRIGMNAVALLIRKQETLQWVAAELAAVSGGVSYPVTYGLVLVGWATAESFADLKELHGGEEIELCKLSGEFFINLDFKFQLKGKQAEKAEAKNPIKLISVSWGYSDYLRLLLLMLPEEKMLLRIADCWQMATGYPLSEHYTQVSIETNRSYKGMIFSEGLLICPMTYNMYKGVLVD